MGCCVSLSFVPCSLASVRLLDSKTLATEVLPSASPAFVSISGPETCDGCTQFDTWWEGVSDLLTEGTVWRVKCTDEPLICTELTMGAGLSPGEERGIAARAGAGLPFEIYAGRMLPDDIMRFIFDLDAVARRGVAAQNAFRAKKLLECRETEESGQHFQPRAGPASLAGSLPLHVEVELNVSAFGCTMDEWNVASDSEHGLSSALASATAPVIIRGAWLTPSYDQLLREHGKTALAVVHGLDIVNPGSDWPENEWMPWVECAAHSATFAQPPYRAIPSAHRLHVPDLLLGYATSA